MKDKSIIIIGLGTIATAFLPLLFKRLNLKNVTVLSDKTGNFSLHPEYPVNYQQEHVSKSNYKRLLKKHLKPGDVLINLAYRVGTLDLLKLCKELDCHYLDTCYDIWPGPNMDSLALRESVLKKRAFFKGAKTSVLCHGANPGMITHFAKRAIQDLAFSHLPQKSSVLKTRRDWVRAAKELNVAAIHIAEKDTQKSAHVSDSFTNTWSIQAFVEESQEKVAFAWGTLEEDFQTQIKKKIHQKGACRFIEMDTSSGLVKTKSWVPSVGVYEGFPIPHTEPFSIAEFFTEKDKDGKILYQPTVLFVYHPCEAASESMIRVSKHNWKIPEQGHILGDDIVSGQDELGALILRTDTHEIYWFGSALSIQEVRKIVSHSNATSLQVVAGVISGLIWMLENPNRGVVEPEDMDFERVLELATPYLGKVYGWKSTIEKSSPKDWWQFKKLFMN